MMRKYAKKRLAISTTVATVGIIVALIIGLVGGYLAGSMAAAPATATVTVTQTVEKTVTSTVPGGPAVSRIVIGVTDKVSDIDPANAYDFYTWEVLTNIMGELMRYVREKSLS